MSLTRKILLKRNLIQSLTHIYKVSLVFYKIPPSRKFKRKFFSFATTQSPTQLIVEKRNGPNIHLRIYLSTHYLQRRDVNWDKVPFVARPSLIADPITAFGKRKTLNPDQPARREGFCVQRLKAEIKPKPMSSLRPLETYKSPRDLTRDKVANEILYHQRYRESGGLTSYCTDKNSLDVVLKRVHGSSSLPREFRGPIY